MKTFLLVAACLGSVLTAPQYGNIGGSAPQPQRTPVSGSSIRCRTEQATIWDTTYVETQENICNTVYVNQCQTLYERQCRPTTREVCQTTNEQQCSTSYREECHDEFRTEYEAYTETECNTSIKEDCQYHWEGAGNEKVWVVDRSTCSNNPYDHCVDVEKQNERQVPYPVCNQVPVKNCVNVPVTKCQQVPDQKCTNEPYQKCDQVPQEKCNVEHKKTPQRVSRIVPKKVCEGGSQIGVRSGEEQEKDVEQVKEKIVKNENAIMFSL
jgi:hypothetical protein